MRAIFSKVVAVSMIAGAGLLVTACQTETTSNTTNVSTTTEVLSSENGAEGDMVGGADGATNTGNVVDTTTTTNTVTTNTVTE